MHPALLLLQADESRVLEHFTAGRLLLVFFIILAAWLLIRYSSRLLALIASRSSRARFVVRWAEPVLRISLWFLAIFFSFDVLAPTRETFFAAIGSVAIAIGLGAQDLIKNLVGGLVVLADRPYQLGDRVKIGDAYGEIDHIGLRSTKLTTPDDTRVTIPNADVLTEKIYNANSGVPDCQVVTDLYVPFDFEVDKAVRIGYEAALTSPYVWLAKAVVVLASHGFDQQPYVRIRVKAYVFDHRFEPRLQHDITCRAHEKLQQLGAFHVWR
jgi:small-conductance mechanosensitive channel